MNVLEQFDEIFTDINSLDQTKVEGFLKECLTFFASLQDNLKSGDETEKQKALDLAAALQQKLEDFAKKAIAQTGLDPSMIGEFAKTSAVSNLFLKKKG